MGMVARTARASRIRATTTNRSRPPASTTTSTPKEHGWFRFQSDTGLQAAYTDPINPLFDAISPQPLYSFAAGLHARFLQESGELLQPGVLLVREPVRAGRSSEDAFGVSHRAPGQRRERALHAPSEGLTTHGCRARRAARFFINDNLAWTVGAHELRFGTNTRIFRLNDYDFGEGAVPLVTYTTLPQFIYGVASTASERFRWPIRSPTTF